MLGDLGLDEVLAQRLQARVRTPLVGRHEARVADDVGGQNRRKPALHARLPWTGSTTTSTQKMVPWLQTLTSPMFVVPAIRSVASSVHASCASAPLGQKTGISAARNGRYGMGRDASGRACHKEKEAPLPGMRIGSDER